MLLEAKKHTCCCYCLHAEPLDEEHMLCPTRGPVELTHSCRRFVYDPLQRKPVRAPQLKAVPQEAFEL